MGCKYGSCGLVCCCCPPASSPPWCGCQEDSYDDEACINAVWYWYNPDLAQYLEFSFGYVVITETEYLETSSDLGTTECALFWLWTYWYCQDMVSAGEIDFNKWTATNTYITTSFNPNSTAPNGSTYSNAINPNDYYGVQSNATNCYLAAYSLRYSPNYVPFYGPIVGGTSCSFEFPEYPVQ